LAITVNLEGSPILKEAYFDGTSITGCDLADGASIEKLHLPSTITTLTLVNLNKLTEFVCPDFSNVSRLMISNMDANVVNPLEILKDLPANSQVNIQGLNFEVTGSAEIEQFLDLLDTMRGVSREKNSSGEWMYHDYDTAQVSGTIHTASLTGEQIASYNARYPYIKVEADHVTSYLTYASYDGATTYKVVTCLDGVPQESAPASPTRESTAQYSYTFVGWSKSQDSTTADSDAQTAVLADRTIYAAYTATVRTYTIQWKNYDGTTIETDSNVPYGSTPHYDGSTPTYDGQTSTGWTPEPTTVTGDAVYTATYLPVYSVYFYNGSTLLQTVRVQQGGTAVYTGTTPVSPDGTAEEGYEFTGWSPSPTNVQANLSTYAQYTSPVQDVEITDSWDTIIANIDNGTYKTKYALGNYKPLDLGTEGIINMQIVAFDSDELASGGYAPITFIGKELLLQGSSMNSTKTNENGYPATDVMKPLLDNTIYPLISSNVRARIQRTKKTYFDYTTQSTLTSVEKLWIPSYREVGAENYSENDGVIYGSVYKDASTRIKNKNGSASNWWLRSATYNNAGQFWFVQKTGNLSYFDANLVALDVCLGFCLGLESETITDTWSEIFTAESDGTYSTKYSIGDTKMLDLGTEGQHLMEIVAFDTDDKADGSGKAKITWISKNQLATTHTINATKKTVDGETTYTAGGWEHSDMRAYLKETVKQLIPETVRNAIVPVTKVSSTYTGGAKVKDGQTTTDDVWIPSNHEVGFGTDYETTGAVYSGKFTSNVSRIKKRNGSAKYWWLRSVNDANYFRLVYSDGYSYNFNANHVYGVALGFCT